MSTVASTCPRLAPSARITATSRLRSSDEPTMLTRIPIAETITTSVVTSKSKSSSGRTKSPSSTLISRIGSAAWPSRPSLICVLSAMAVSSAGRPGSETVSRRIAVTSRCSRGSGAGVPVACCAGFATVIPSTGFACPSWR